MKFNVLSAAIAAILSTHAFADAPDVELPSMVVSADFRPSQAQQTPISLTTIDSEVIESRGAQHLEDVLNMSPNVNFSSGASRGHYFQIRGIGERSQFTSPVNPSVGLVIDGIDFSRSGAAATLFDIEQIEILRGPQGTAYGANALAGLINLNSKDATEDLDIHFESTLAEYNTRSVGLAVGGPLIEDTLLGRFAIHTNKSDGYSENKHLNKDNTNNRDETTIRTNLKWLATNDLTLSLKYLHLDLDNGYDAFTFDNSRNTFSDQPGSDRQKTNAFSLRTDWNISSVLKIESILSHSNSDLEYSFDEDWSFDGQFDASLFPYSSFDQYQRDRNNDSVDIRLLSNTDGRIFNDSTDWVIGLYYAEQDEDLVRNYTYLPDAFISSYDTKNTAVYGQLDSALTEKLTLISGLRIEHWQANYLDSNSIDVDSSETLYGGKLGLNYQLTADHLAFSSLSRGYKAGGVNTDGRLPNSALNFDTEYLWNLEVGLKSSWLDDRLNTNISLFYAQRKDQQVQSSLLTVRPDLSTEFVSYLTNAAEGKNMGIEAELDWLITPDWRLFANIGLLRATFEEYEDPDGLDVSGRDQAHSPKYQFTAGTEYYLGQNWTFNTKLEGKDDFYFSDRHNAKSKSYALVNANIEYAIDSWRVNLWGRNLFDKEYAVRGFGSFGNNPGNGYITETYTQQGEPRIVGLTLSYDY
ncbi:TonB-dependent receptor [Pseudomonadota bacterium]|nr:TonB-dependent receptor [Pseudomonadota bacterium]